MRRSNRVITVQKRRHVIIFGLVAVIGASSAMAQPLPGSTTPRSEAEFLVPPQGGAFEVVVHVREVCILSFPEKLSGTALASSPDFEIKRWGDDGVAIRAVSETRT